MIEILAQAPLLTLFLVIALGTLVGAIPFGPIKFGPAGALFVGLAIGALDPSLGEGFGIVQSIGLALFVYTIGLAAGASFFRDLRKQTPLLIGTVVLLAIYALLIAFSGKPLDISSNLLGGMFAGSLTTTPALAAAASAAGGSTEPAVGYAIAYPVGVIVTMVIITFVTSKRLPGGKDPDPVSAAGLHSETVHVDRPMRILDVPGIAEIVGSEEGQVRISYLNRSGRVRVADPEENLFPGDEVLVVGTPESVAIAADALGHVLDRNITHDRSSVDFRRFVVSNPKIAGRTVAELHIPSRFNGLITRIRRGDTDMLATAESRLQTGDRVMVVVPGENMEDIEHLFGNSERKITEVDFWSVGIGIAIGVAIGLVAIPLGGGAVLSLGSAAGPLVVGLILGKLDRTGPIIWAMPNAANLTIRQLGLVLFLAAVGLSSGQAFASTAFSPTGIKIGVLSAVLLTPILLTFWFLGNKLGLSMPRVAGAMAGFIGQPAILSHVQSVVVDERTESGYSATFALGIIVKILLVQVVMMI
ncbi:TrkA C-terminal domain-containing protein [Propionimicrobium lymphophilum]|uniref:aspartate:alanine exchanger family transporter n=1 Tax=Propionimicrobium lymphophilum TaxID=33012 RepID=UPI00254A740A|nr:TrkA C-terminal domain-containing protein [Propionimicrobium lymphophilum]MDK7709024.1 TrkA C-terminal domain-containing protein [Propionimicrobium lymphophilum]MDK7733029.1 TrkA C-terminal domain-containing protein [Propionimicrobium lymphophilum]